MSKFSITIATGVNFYTAIFKRQYTLKVETINDSHIGTLNFQDYTPSGMCKGGDKHHGVLVENITLTPAHFANINSTIASMAFNNDPVIGSRSGCEQYNAGVEVLSQKLRTLIVTKPVKA